MTVWQELREELSRLLQALPDALVSYSNPDGDPDGHPPFLLRLDPSALALAEDLHQRFGDHVHVRLGALPYPMSVDDSPYGPLLREPLPLDHRLEEIKVDLDGPLTMKSGQTAITLC